MSSKLKRKELIDGINVAGRFMSTATVIFHQAVAENAGLSGADHKYIDILMREGNMTAGRLAELTGLTTGAITGVIDRMEKGGLVKRQNDPNDRRKVLIVPQVEKVMEKMAVFKDLEEDLTKYYDKFSDEALEIIRVYLNDMNNFFTEQTRKLKNKS
jgi:DNA-binding MarR family transcriptional regulator